MPRISTDEPGALSAPAGAASLFDPDIAAATGDTGQDVVGKLDPPDPAALLAGEQPGVHQPAMASTAATRVRPAPDQFMCGRSSVCFRETRRR